MNGFNGSVRERQEADRPQRHLRIALAREADRSEIYRQRHAVYAHELGQHPANGRGMLCDGLDEFNTYVVARAGSAVAGFVSITPPPESPGLVGRCWYSFDKYVRREVLPFDIDDHVYEVRLLTVGEQFRTSKATALLMYAALRWIEDRGGRRIVAIGRHEVLDLYRKVGMEPLGIEVRSGRVTFEVMTATVETLRSHLTPHTPRLRRLVAGGEWDLGIPFEQPACFHGGSFFEAIGERLDDLDRRERVINADVLDAWFDPSPQVLAALRRDLPWLLRTSPPTAGRGLVETIADTRGVEPVSVLPGAGSSDLVYLALREWVAPTSRVLILDPTYGEYAHVLERVIGCRVDRLTLRRRDDYDLDPDVLARRLGRGYDLVVLVNPNSPTGRHVPREDLEPLLASAPRRTLFWIDETYVEYAGPDQSLERVAAASENVVVCKSMSKVYALSGARAGYLCGARHVLDGLRTHNPPWAVSLPAQLAAIRALQDPPYYASCYARTHRLRAALADGLRRDCDLDVVDGVANFLLCHLSQDQPSAAAVTAACRDRGLFIRDVSNMGSRLGGRAVRIAVKDAATNQQIVWTLANVLSELQERMPC